MAHRGKKCRQDKSDGGTRLRAEAGTRCDEPVAYVALRQYVLEQLIAPRYTSTEWGTSIYTKIRGSRGMRGSTLSGRPSVVLRPEPQFRDVFRFLPRDDDGDKEDEQHCGGTVTQSKSPEITPKRAWIRCSRKRTNKRNPCHWCTVRPHGPEPDSKGGGPVGCSCPGCGETSVEFIAQGEVLEPAAISIPVFIR